MKKQIKRTAALLMAAVMTAAIQPVVIYGEEGVVPESEPDRSVKLNRVVCCYDEDLTHDVYLKITPKDEVLSSDSIIIELENGEFDEYYFHWSLNSYNYESLQGEGLTYESLMNTYKNLAANGKDPKLLLDSLWAQTADVYLPWEIELIDSGKIEVKLFPVPSDYCGNVWSGEGVGNGNTPYYYIPLPALAKGNEGLVKAKIDANDSPVDSGTLVIASIGANYKPDRDISDYAKYGIAVNKFVKVKTGEEIKDVYLKIVPQFEIESGSAVVIEFEDSEVCDSLPEFGDIQGEGNSYDALMKKYNAVTEGGTNDRNSRSILNSLWSGTEDVFIPWKLTKISGNRVLVELFPIPSYYCGTYWGGIGAGNGVKPYYYIPLKVVLKKEGEAKLRIYSADNFRIVDGGWDRVSSWEEYLKEIAAKGELPVLGAAVPSGVITYAKAEKAEGLEKGNIDGNDKIDSTDATLVLLCAAKLTTLTDAQFAAADVNGDGDVNSTDATNILLYAAGLGTL